MPPRSHLPPPLRTLFDGRLLGARCVGHHDLFDAELDDVRETAEERSARHTAAARICARCPVQGPCATVATEAGSHAHGVWAGRNLTPTARPGRPRKDTAA